MSISTKTTQKKAPSSGTVFKKQAKTKTPSKQSSPAQDILNLHQTIGNRGVQRLFESGFIQGKLTVGEPNDKYEQEADRVADEVMRMPEPKVQRQSDEEEEKEEMVQTKPIGERITPLVQREVEPEEEKEEEQIQAKAERQTPQIKPDLESEIKSLKGQGDPLPNSARKEFESRFKYDFGSVRIHTDTQASKLALKLHAQAFVYGNDIFFAEGKYDPESSSGKRLLAHELTHVIQQKVPFVQRKANKAMPEGNVAPGVIDLKKMPIFKPDLAMDGWLDEQKRSRGRVKVHYGNLAEGVITVQKRREGKYSIKKQALPLRHPLFHKMGEASAKLQPSLIVYTGKNGSIKGFVGLSASARNNKSSIVKYLRKSPEIIGLSEFHINKIKNITNKLENGQLTMGINNMPIKFANVLNGSFSIAATDESIQTFEGNLSVSVKGLEKGELNIKRAADGKVTGKGEVGLQLPKNFSGNLIVEWDGSAFGGEGKVGYAGEKLSGSITLKVMEKTRAAQLEQEQKSPPKKVTAPAKKRKPKNESYVVFGEGDLTFAFNEWLNGTSHVIVDPKGQVTVIGEITPQKEFELFPQKDYNKELFKVEARASYGLPVVGNIFIFANIGLFAFAKLGPAKFYKIKVAGTYSTDPKKRKNFTIQGSLNVSAAAGLKLRGEAGAGLEILAHDIKAGAGINALAGIRGYAEATPVIGYREKAKKGEDKKGEFFIKGDLEIAAQPFLGLGGDLFVEVDSPWWSPLGDKKWTWPLGNKEWPMGGSFGINASLDYVFGSKQFPTVEFKKVNFSADKFLTDLYSDKAKAKSGDKGEKKGQWKEKNTKSSEPSGKTKKGNLDEGKSPKLPKAKSKVKPGGSKKATKPVDPNAKTAEGKSVKQLQKEATQKGKKTAPKEVSKGKAKETSKETPKQIHDKQLKAGLAALDAVTNRYAKDGATFKEMTIGVKSVRRKFKVFKSISVIEKNGYWYYDYAASPGKQKRGPSKNQIEKLVKQKALKELTTTLKQKKLKSLDEFKKIVTSIYNKHKKNGLKSLSTHVVNVPNMTVAIEASASPTEGVTVRLEEIVSKATQKEIEELKDKFKKQGYETYAALIIDGKEKGSFSSKSKKHAEIHLLDSDAWENGIKKAIQLVKNGKKPTVAILINRTPCSNCTNALVKEIVKIKNKYKIEAEKIHFLLAPTGVYEPTDPVSDREAADKETERFAKELGTTIKQVIRKHGKGYVEYSKDPNRPPTKANDLRRLINAGWDMKTLLASKKQTNASEILHEFLENEKNKIASKIKISSKGLKNGFSSDKK